MEPKFKIGQKVKFIQDPDSEAGVIKSYFYNPDKGFVYTFEAKELDIPNKQVITGVKHGNENELVLVSEVVNG